VISATPAGKVSDRQVTPVLTLLSTSPPCELLRPTAKHVETDGHEISTTPMTAG
jgi:hypothetical protein